MSELKENRLYLFKRRDDKTIFECYVLELSPSGLRVKLSTSKYSRYGDWWEIKDLIVLEEMKG